jgi:hypothetical protein
VEDFGDKATALNIIEEAIRFYQESFGNSSENS